MYCSGSAYQGEQQNRTATCSGNSRVRRESGDRPAAAVCRGRAGIRTAASVCSSQGLACISPAQRESGGGGGGLQQQRQALASFLAIFFRVWPSSQQQCGGAVNVCPPALEGSTCAQGYRSTAAAYVVTWWSFVPTSLSLAAIEGRTAPPLPILRYIYRDTDWKDHQRVQRLHMQLPNSSVQLPISAFGCCNCRLAAPQLALSSLWCHLLLERPQPHRTPTMWCWSPVSPVSFLPPSYEFGPRFHFCVLWSVMRLVPNTAAPVAAPTGPFPRQQALQWGLVQQTGQQPTGPREVAKHNQTHAVHCKPLYVMFPIHRRGLSYYLF